jgi:hypothetical protein
MKNPLKLVDKRGLSVMLGSILLLTLISVIAIVLSVSANSRRAIQAEESRLRREQKALSSNTSFGMEDYYLDIRDPDTGIVYPARQSRRYWTQEEVDFYWISPSEAGIDTLTEDNDALVLRSLGVPSPEASP